MIITEEQIDQEISSLPPWIEISPETGESLTQMGPGVQSSATSLEHIPSVLPWREFVWRTDKWWGVIFKDISRQFGISLEFSFFNSSFPLQQLHGHDLAWTVHWYWGYIWDDVNLTTNILYSTVISYDTSTPQEICTVCGDMVEEAGFFFCVCGGDGE